MTNSNQRPTTDNFLYRMISNAMGLEEGVLTGESVKSFFEVLTHGQLEAFLKTQKHFPYQVSETGKVIPQFTKHVIIHHLKKDYLESGRKYIHSEPLDPEGLL